MRIGRRGSSDFPCPPHPRPRPRPRPRQRFTTTTSSTQRSQAPTVDEKLRTFGCLWRSSVGWVWRGLSAIPAFLVIVARRVVVVKPIFVVSDLTGRTLPPPPTRSRSDSNSSNLRDSSSPPSARSRRSERMNERNVISADVARAHRRKSRVERCGTPKQRNLNGHPTSERNVRRAAAAAAAAAPRSPPPPHPARDCALCELHEREDEERARRPRAGGNQSAKRRVDARGCESC